MLMSDFAKALRPERVWEQPHAERYLKTMELALAYFPALGALKHLDTGGANCFSDAMRACGCDVVVSGNHDLRNRLPYPDNAFDFVWSLEVLEHIRDREDSPIADWNGSGQTSYLRGMLRVVKPGGSLILTTPNSCGWTALYRIMHGDPPRFYDPHVRELNQGELGHITTLAGWKVVHCRGMDVWNQMDAMKDETWRRKMLPLLSPCIRSDDLFLICQKV